MKKLVKLCAAILSLSALVSVAQAANPGTYFGAGLGLSKQQTPNEYLYNISNGSTSRELGGLGGRVFGGYNFNKYVGMELGLARYADSLYKANNFGSSASTRYSMASLDLVGKAYLPISDSGFNVYALGGAARVASKVKYSNPGNVPLATGVSAPRPGTSTTYAFRPIYGIGASYDIPQSQLTTSLELSRIQGRGDVKTSSNAIPSANMLTVNLAYNIG